VKEGVGERLKACDLFSYELFESYHLPYIPSVLHGEVERQAPLLVSLLERYSLEGEVVPLPSPLFVVEARIKRVHYPLWGVRLDEGWEVALVAEWTVGEQKLHGLKFRPAVRVWGERGIRRMAIWNGRLGVGEIVISPICIRAFPTFALAVAMARARRADLNLFIPWSPEVVRVFDILIDINERGWRVTLSYGFKHRGCLHTMKKIMFSRDGSLPREGRLKGFFDEVEAQAALHQLETLRGEL